MSTPKVDGVAEELSAREREGVNAMHPTVRLDLQIAALDELIAVLEASKRIDSKRTPPAGAVRS